MLNQTCECGKPVRRIKTGNTGWYPTENSKTGMPFFEMRYASDGLCERCYLYGAPKLSNNELEKIALGKKRARGSWVTAKKALAEIEGGLV